MELDKAIKERHSVRKFSSKNVDWREIIEAIDMAKYIPSAGNIPTVKFILVSDEKKIQQLAEACQQDFVADAKYVAVVCSNETQTTRSYGDRGKKYTSQQAGAAIQNFLLKLTELNLATCWIGAFSELTVRSVLDIPDEIEIEALFPIGYELGKTTQKRKSDLDYFLYFNKWKNKNMKPFKVVMR